jgi:hypothetical protein
MTTGFAAAKLDPRLEAILVVALEPRQNCKRGDNLAEVEYISGTSKKISLRVDSCSIHSS